LSPTVTIGLGLVRVSSAKRVPLPAARITAFTLCSLLLIWPWSPQQPAP